MAVVLAASTVSKTAVEKVGTLVVKRVAKLADETVCLTVVG